jgi:PAS domain-containing protein
MQQATRLDPLPLNSLLEVLPDGIAFVDEYGVICHVNERLESLTGYARDFLVGQAVDVLLQSRSACRPCTECQPKGSRSTIPPWSIPS